MKSAIGLATAAAFALNVYAQDKPKPPPGGEGKPAAMADSPLKPHPGKMTETPARLPGGRAMARGDKGKIYLGTRIIGRVYEVTDTGGKRTVRVVADKLTQPTGVAGAALPGR